MHEIIYDLKTRTLHATTPNFFFFSYDDYAVQTVRLAKMQKTKQ